MITIVIRCLLIMFFVFAGVACTHNIYRPYQADNVSRALIEASHQQQASFEYTKQQSLLMSEQSLKIKQRQQRGGRYRWSISKHVGPHEVKLLSFPSAGDNAQINNEVQVRYYKSVKPGRKKLVIVLPIYGSYKYPTEEIAKGVRARSGGDTNVAVFLADNFLLDFEGLAQAGTEAEFERIALQMRQRIITTVIDMRRFIDWAEEQSDIDSQQIGLVGFSMSALPAVLTTLVEPRLQATVIVMGAAQPYDILTACPGRPGYARQSTMQRFGWTLEEYRQKMFDVFKPLDPQLHAGSAVIDPKAILMIDAHYDECMPKPTREALWKALGYPERVSYLYSHKKAFLSMTPLGFNVMRKRIYGFFDKRFDNTELKTADIGVE